MRVIDRWNRDLVRSDVRGLRRGDVVAVTGYDGLGVARVLRVEAVLAAGVLRGVCLLGGGTVRLDVDRIGGVWKVGAGQPEGA